MISPRARPTNALITSPTATTPRQAARMTSALKSWVVETLRATSRPASRTARLAVMRPSGERGSFGLGGGSGYHPVVAGGVAGGGPPPADAGGGGGGAETDDEDGGAARARAGAPPAGAGPVGWADSPR